MTVDEGVLRVLGGKGECGDFSESEAFQPESSGAPIITEAHIKSTSQANPVPIVTG